MEVRREARNRVHGICCGLQCCYQHVWPSSWNRLSPGRSPERLRSGVLNYVFRQCPVRAVDNILIVVREVALQTDRTNIHEIHRHIKSWQSEWMVHVVPLHCHMLLFHWHFHMCIANACTEILTGFHFSPVLYRTSNPLIQYEDHVGRCCNCSHNECSTQIQTWFVVSTTNTQSTLFCVDCMLFLCAGGCGCVSVT